MSHRNWYEIILWWELRRIPYNLIMYFAGLLSFYISYVSIPLIYVLMGLAFNIVYTFGWIFELLIIRKEDGEKRIKYPKYIFVWYLVLSVVIVFGVALFLMTM